MVTVNETNREPDGTFGALEAGTITDGADVSHSDELADATDVSPIQSSSDVTVEDTSTSGANGTVPVSQGNGTLSMQSVDSNTPDWQKDGNSPDSATNTGSFTYTLSGTYDHIEVFVDITNKSGGNGVYNLRLNGDADQSYNYVEFSGQTISNASEFKQIGELAPDGRIGGRFALGGNGSDGYVYNHISLGSTVDNGSNIINIGYNDGLTPPLDNFTIFEEDSRDTDITVEVYGRTT